MDSTELAKRVDVDALVEHCGGSVKSALDAYLNDQALCRKVAPPKVQSPLSAAQQRGHEHVAHELLMSERPLALDADEDEAELARALELSMAGGDDGEAEAEAQVGRAK